jgi:hypothetical protein
MKRLYVLVNKQEQPWLPKRDAGTCSARPNGHHVRKLAAQHEFGWSGRGPLSPSPLAGRTGR